MTKMRNVFGCIFYVIIGSAKCYHFDWMELRMAENTFEIKSK